MAGAWTAATGIVSSGSVGQPALSQAVRHQDGMTYLVSFGESGKNFIEIGERPKVQETMLRLAVP